MQICSKCHQSSADDEKFCHSCNADLSVFSETAQALQRIIENERVKMVRVTVSQDCCPACLALEGTYSKDNVPHLPIEGCSHKLGCRCYYTPVLDILYP